jgi:hypothetical protein
MPNRFLRLIAITVTAFLALPTASWMTSARRS